jgi:hypothetical protein
MGTFANEGRGGLIANPREAVKWWRRAAEQGQPYAQAQLGAAYIEGKGVIRDVVEGYAWLAASEVPDGKPVLAELDKKMPRSMLEKAKRFAAERRALRDKKPADAEPGATNATP